eukprot:388738-Prymnesium_polylepis.1
MSSYRVGSSAPLAAPCASASVAAPSASDAVSISSAVSGVGAPGPVGVGLVSGETKWRYTSMPRAFLDSE